MTSTRLELDQLAQGLFFWPVRALDRGLRHAGVRRAVKVAVDFCCGAAAVVTAVAVSEGIPSVGVAETASLALLVGLVLVVADGLGGSYRAIWRYTSMREAITLGVSSGVVLGEAILAGWFAGTGCALPRPAPWRFSLAMPGAFPPRSFQGHVPRGGAIVPATASSRAHGRCLITPQRLPSVLQTCFCS